MLQKRNADLLCLMPLMLVCGSLRAEILLGDVTTEANIIAPHSAIKPKCGQAIGDVNRDGNQDLFVTGYYEPNHLFLNSAEGHFSESSFSSQLSPVGAVCGPAAFADYNNDGWVDLYIACDGDNFLFRNNSFQSFTDVTAEAGVNISSYSESVAWADVNQDGWLDLFVGTYPTSLMPDISNPINWDHLWLNNGDGSFTDISHVFDPVQLSKPVLATMFTDIDNDQDVDLYVVNDKEIGNTLWINEGPGCGGWCFSDVSVSTGAHRPVFGMGIAAGDVDLDGDLDLYFSSVAEQVLLRNDLEKGQLGFTEVSDSAGLNFNAVGWGTHFLDFDNDQWLDAYLVTGGAVSGVNTDRVYRNQSMMSFLDITDTSGGSDPLNTIGVSQWDYNRDGLQDLIVCGNDTAYKLYENQTTQAGNWLEFRLEGGGEVNLDAIGSRLVLTTGHRSNPVVQMRDVTSGQSRGGNSSLIQHFGIAGSSTADLEIQWTDGKRTRLQNLSANYQYTFYHPDSDKVFLAGFE